MTQCYIPGGPKKRPELSHGVMQQSRWNESAEKHVCNEQKSLNMSMNFHLKRFHISRDTSEIVLQIIKQCLQAVRHLYCWLYAGYTRTSQKFVSVNWSAENVLNRSSILLCHSCQTPFPLLYSFSDCLVIDIVPFVADNILKIVEIRKWFTPSFVDKFLQDTPNWVI